MKEPKWEKRICFIEGCKNTVKSGGVKFGYHRRVCQKHRGYTKNLSLTYKE